MNFSDRVKTLKSEMHMTSDELSLRSGIPLGTLTKILSGAISEPKLSTALAIADALGCPIGTLVGGDTVLCARDDRESALLLNFRASDPVGREAIYALSERERVRAASSGMVTDVPKKAAAPRGRAKIAVPFFLTPVSAGTGAMLDGDDRETIDVPESKSAKEADFALRVSGNSMEPAFCDGDVLLVKMQSEVAKGEFGIFVGDGEGYFKRFMGDSLHSINPDYADIPISIFSDFACRGKVIGRLKKKKSASANVE